MIVETEKDLFKFIIASGLATFDLAPESLQYLLKESLELWIPFMQSAHNWYFCSLKLKNKEERRDV
jgi:hypothetical protein